MSNLKNILNIFSIRHNDQQNTNNAKTLNLDLLNPGDSDGLNMEDMLNFPMVDSSEASGMENCLQQHAGDKKNFSADFLEQQNFTPASDLSQDGAVISLLDDRQSGITPDNFSAGLKTHFPDFNTSLTFSGSGQLNGQVIYHSGDEPAFLIGKLGGNHHGAKPVSVTNKPNMGYHSAESSADETDTLTNILDSIPASSANWSDLAVSGGRLFQQLRDQAPVSVNDKPNMGHHSAESSADETDTLTNILDSIPATPANWSDFTVSGGKLSQQLRDQAPVSVNDKPNMGHHSAKSSADETDTLTNILDSIPAAPANWSDFTVSGGKLSQQLLNSADGIRPGSLDDKPNGDRHSTKSLANEPDTFSNTLDNTTANFTNWSELAADGNLSQQLPDQADGAKLVLLQDKLDNSHPGMQQVANPQGNFGVNLTDNLQTNGIYAELLQNIDQNTPLLNGNVLNSNFDVIGLLNLQALNLPDNISNSFDEVGNQVSVLNGLYSQIIQHHTILRPDSQVLASKKAQDDLFKIAENKLVEFKSQLLITVNALQAILAQNTQEHNNSGLVLNLTGLMEEYQPLLEDSLSDEEFQKKFIDFSNKIHALLQGSGRGEASGEIAPDPAIDFHSYGPSPTLDIAENPADYSAISAVNTALNQLGHSLNQMLGALDTYSGDPSYLAMTLFLYLAAMQSQLSAMNLNTAPAEHNDLGSN